MNEIKKRVNLFLRSEGERLLADERHGKGAYGLDPKYLDTMIEKCRDIGDDVALALWSRVKYRANSHRFRFLQKGPGKATKA